MGKNSLKKVYFSIIAISVLLLSSCSSMAEIFSNDVVTEGSKIATDILLDVTMQNSDNLDAIKKSKDESIDSLSNASKFELIEPEEEYELGRSVAANVVNQYGLYNNKSATNYLNKICKTLAYASDRPCVYKDYCVAILDSDEINAISTPGGHILIAKGLIECTNSEDALAAVIAHELSHIQLNHSSNIIKDTRWREWRKDTAAAGLSLLNADNKQYSTDVAILNKLSDGFVDKINSGYSKSQEYDADENAIKIMAAAGYDPYAMLDMLEAIDKNSKNSDKGWKKSHPAPKNRIREAEKVLRRGHYEHADNSKRTERFEQFKKSL